MRRGRVVCQLLCVAQTLSLRAKAVQQPIVPIVQLTAQADRFPDRDKCLGGVLLRELQRQSVLIAARDELGLATRDMVLREPFTAPVTNGATTLLFESRILKNDKAQICLSRFDGSQPTDPYSLADLQFDPLKNAPQHFVSFPIPQGSIADYPDFVTQCEKASRGSYLQALLVEKVLGTCRPNPIQWAAAGTPAPVDQPAIQRLQHFDVFSQYLAVRFLHQQNRSQGASPERLSALVRGYANLAALTHDQWSRADKVFLARALLYAQRLVIHENASSASLYVRAYARAFTGLHSAALDDLDAAAKMSGPGAAPPWVPLIRAMCRFDPIPLDDFIASGPWQYRQLATFLAARVTSDKFPADQFQDAVDRALTDYPGMFVLAADSQGRGDTANSKPADHVIEELPVVVVEVLKTADLPASVNYAVRHLTPGDDSFKQLASLRDRLNSAVSKAPGESTEPSLGVLADLLEEQEMLAIVRHALASKLTGAGNADVQRLASNAMPILKVHPWGAYIDAIGLEPNGQETQMAKIISKIRDRDSGPWADDAMKHIDGLPDSSGAHVKALRDRATFTADLIVYDYKGGADEPQLSRLCEISPHSGTLLQAWMKSMPAGRIVQGTPLYTIAIARIQDEFSNRPAVMLAGCDWCNSCGDFERSLSMLLKVDQIEPSFDVCSRIARLTRHLGRHDESISQLMRAVKLTSDPADIASAYQQAAVDLIDDHRYDEALACVQMSAEAPTSRIWQLMARCFEAMGQLDDADESLRQQAIADPPAIAQHYMWAKRLERKDAKAIRQKALAVFAQSTEFMPEFYMAMCDDQEDRAFDILRRYRGSIDDAFSLAQLAILAKVLNAPVVLKDALDSMSSADSNDSFGAAFEALARSKDIHAGIDGFELWVSRQLDEEDAVDWYSLLGRYLNAIGHPAEAKAYLIRAIRQPTHEREDYFLAWHALQKMGENPHRLLANPATRQ